MVLLLQSHAVALDGLHHFLDGLVLCHHHLLQFRRHIAQTKALRLLHALHGHTRHHRHHIGHLVLRDGHLLADLTFLPAVLGLFELLLALHLLVAEARRHLKVLVLDRILLLLLDLLDLILQIHNLLRHLRMLQVDMRSHLI